jgi:hypothetical protein
MIVTRQNSRIPVCITLGLTLYFTLQCTLPSQWFLAPARLYAYQPLLQIVQIPDVLSKEGAVIGAVLGTGKFHRVITDIRHIWIIAE